MLHGCLVIRNGKIIFKGNNNPRTCYNGSKNIPVKIKKNKELSTHAEMDGLFKFLKKNPRKNSKITILVVRISINSDKTVNLLNSAPCANCLKNMRIIGVKNIAYSNREGEIVCIKLSDYETTYLSYAQKKLI